MAIQKQHTHNRLEFPNFFWVIARIDFSPIGETLWIDLWGFQDKEAFLANRRGEGNQPLQTGRIEVESHHYREFFSTEAMSREGNNLLKAIYVYLQTVHQVGGQKVFADAKKA